MALRMVLVLWAIGLIAVIAWQARQPLRERKQADAQLRELQGAIHELGAGVRALSWLITGNAPRSTSGRSNMIH